ncbi:hypothetical protein DACRYDRAFT_34940, partial [Dacryopinax primogenitus]
SALDKYNDLTKKLNTPCPILMYNTVISMMWVSDLTILQYSRNNVQCTAWADKLVRSMTVKWLLVQCAKEKMCQLDVKVRRLWTAVHNEPHALQETISREASAWCSLLTVEMCCHLEKREAVDLLLHGCIQQIFALPGF